MGFILFAGKSESSGDCIVRALPMQANLFESEEFKSLAKLQDVGEFNFHFDVDKSELRIFKENFELLFQKASSDERLIGTGLGVPVYGIFTADAKR